MRYEGTIYRPWPEADSLLIQATLGCSANTCTFCAMFRDKKFRVRDVEDVLRDIDTARRIHRRVGSIFLIDGNVLAMKTAPLIRILNKLRDVFPEAGRIALYGSLNDLRRKSVDELTELKKAGLDLVYVGLESGDPVVLDRIRKHLTPEQAVEGMEHARAAGIEVLLSIILGLGGRDRSREHIEATTSLLNRLRPEQLAPMALAIQPGTELEREVERGEFVLPSPMQVLEEERHLLEHLGDFPCYYWGDHGNNIAPMRGRLPEHRTAFLARLEQARTYPTVTQHDTLQTFAW